MYFNSEDVGFDINQPNLCDLASPHEIVSSATQSTVTVLTSVVSRVNPHVAPHLNKRYFIDKSTGKLAITNYQSGYHFKFEDKPVNNIHELASLLTEISSDPKKMIIRGLRKPSQAKMSIIRRTNNNFAEHPAGTPFVMLDFDKIATDRDPLTVEAIESVIAKLPTEFHNITYYYQHSNSAGILNDDGQAFKQGLNAHVFFWLNQRVTGPSLTAYLKKHCLNTGFYSVGEDRGGSVRITYGIDPAPIYSAVQAHYTASPSIEAGVVCRLAPDQRQGLVVKAGDVVCMPVIASTIATEARHLAEAIKFKYEKDHGFIRKQLQSRTADGVAMITYTVNPNASAQGVRVLKGHKLSKDGQFVTLYFEGENSSGSWFVSKLSPLFAQRFGDAERLPLKEFSVSAHDFVRDTLNWFAELPVRQLSLINGYVPATRTFAQAKVSLILAPTGSGKTKATIDWMREKFIEHGVVVYAAPTIALVNQMSADIKAVGLPCCNYKEVYRGNLPSRGVIVTTNVSLMRILSLIYEAMWSHYLVCDEIHAGFDEFMRSNRRNEHFELALLKAKQTLLLTGTLTNVQKLGLPTVIGHALSNLNESAYCSYEFEPVKQNPLVLKSLNHFDADFISLMDDLSEKLKQDVALPRVVILLPTSRLNAYRTILDDRELLTVAHIVSRPEDSQSAIDAARTSDLPILIASPLFGVGINLQAEPDILWARFDRLPVDTNHIMQTVNRANRGRVNCHVRVYCGDDVDSKIVLPAKHKLKAEIAARLLEESSILGVLDEHFQIDRNAYQSLRKIERNSNQSLSYLIHHDAIQNYTVIDERVIVKPDVVKTDTFKDYQKQARDEYNAAILRQAMLFEQAEIDQCFWKLEKLAEERKYAYLAADPRVDRLIENEEFGVVMVLCGLPTPQQAKKVNIGKIKRIFGESIPWLSAQYDAEKISHWAKVCAEKTDCIVVLLDKLGGLKAGKLTVAHLVESLSRNKLFCDAFKALAGYDLEYLTISKRLSHYINRCQHVRVSGSNKQRKELKKAGVRLLEGLLEPIGVFFERTDDCVNYDHLIVPERWDLRTMTINLMKQSLRLKVLPSDQKVPVIDVDEYSLRKIMCKDTCEQCAMYYQMACVLGHPVDCFDELLPRSREISCNDFKGIKIKVAA
jgi:hypothetical protein